MQPDLTFGEYVRRLRRRQHMGLNDLAKESELSVSHLSRLENDSGIPNPDTVVKIANALGGDLEQMLKLAKCLPREILERLSRRVDQGADALRRGWGEQSDDPSFARALVEDIDPNLRTALAKRFRLSEQDVEGIFSVLGRMSSMSQSERDGVLKLLGTEAPEHYHGI